MLAFRSARLVRHAGGVERAVKGLNEEALELFRSVQTLGATDGGGGDGRVLMVLIGLRLALFFSFSTGNYLLGGARGVGLRPFLIATVIGCTLSNFVSVTMGMGGGELLKQLSWR